MGGCKCTFQGCGLTTTSSKKLFPDRETHFFHFPVRDPERCVEWAIFSNNMDFLDLPLNKILNKVICDFHFKENNFMNYKRERLTKTNAVPTIYISPNTNAEVDLLTNPTNWVEENKKKELPATFLKSERINIDESSLSAVTFDDPVTSPPPVKKLKQNDSIRILNGKAGASKDITVQRIVKKLPVVTASSPSKAGEHYTIRKIASPSVKPTASGAKVIKQEIISLPPAEELLLEVESNIDLPAEAPPVITITKSRQSSPTKADKVSEDLKPFLMDSLKQIAEIKEMLNEKPAPSTSKESGESQSISQSHLNKVQLFNGIKRYLSPSMNALLRIELFSTPGREMKKDEKIICQELLQLGDKTYNFLSDEWRLRLPAKKEVQQWINERETEEDDDAS